MNKLMITCLVALAAIRVDAQFFGSGGLGSGRSGFGLNIFDQNQNRLNVGQRSNVAAQSLLDDAARNRQAVDAANQEQVQRDAAAREEAAERLSADSVAQAENIVRVADFENADVKTARNEANRLAVSLFDENIDNEAAALQFNRGSKLDFGNREAIADNLDQAAFLNADAFANDAAARNDLFRFNAADEELFRRADRANLQDEAFADVASFDDNRLTQQDNVFEDFGFDEFDGFDGFDGLFFGRRRRR